MNQLQWRKNKTFRINWSTNFRNINEDGVEPGFVYVKLKNKIKLIVRFSICGYTNKRHSN